MEVKGLAIRPPSPEQERPDRGCDRAFGISGARDRARTGDPHVGKEMLGLISLRFFAQSGHIDAFRSIVGEARRRESSPRKINNLRSNHRHMAAQSGILRHIERHSTPKTAPTRHRLLARGGATLSRGRSRWRRSICQGMIGFHGSSRSRFRPQVAGAAEEPEAR